MVVDFGFVLSVLLDGAKISVMIASGALALAICLGL